VHSPQGRGDGVELVDDRVALGGDRLPERRAHVAGQRPVLPAEEQRRPVPLTAIAVDGDDGVDVIEERGECR